MDFCVLARTTSPPPSLKARWCFHDYFILSLNITYWFWDKKSREEIPQRVKCRRDDGSEVWRRCETNSHHAVKSEVGESEEHEHQKQKEFSCIEQESFTYMN